MGYWDIDNIPHDKEAKNIHYSLMCNVVSKINIPIFFSSQAAPSPTPTGRLPSFHHSIIPWLKQNRQASTNTYNFNKL